MGLPLSPPDGEVSPQRLSPRDARAFSLRQSEKEGLPGEMGWGMRLWDSSVYLTLLLDCVPGDQRPACLGHLCPQRLAQHTCSVNRY